MIDHRIIDPRTPCRILYNSINSVTSKTNRRRSNNSLLPPLFETPIDSKNFFPLLLPRLKGFFDCVHACTHTTKRIISRWRIMIGRYNGINSLHRAESYIVRPWMNFFFEQIATLSPHEGSKREGERERERINPLALASNQRTKRVVDIYTISYIYIYIRIFLSIQETRVARIFIKEFHAGREIFSNDTISIFDRKSRGREAVLANEKIYIYI